jgi:hypothetical protein
VEFYAPILNVLFSKGSLSFIEALALPELKGRNYQDILQCFTILMHVGIAHVASSKSAKKSSDAFNNAVYSQNAVGHDISTYALPKHGTGMGIPFFEASVLETLKKHPKAVDDILISEVWNHYLASARRPTKNGTPLINNNEAIEAIKLEMTPEFIKAKRLEFKQLGLLD